LLKQKILAPLAAQRHNEESWYCGLQQWIVATTGLIHGIDCQQVGAVILDGLPVGAINLHQGFGRLGRDGQPAMVFLVHNHFVTHILTRDPDEDV
jgi:superfamily II DNA helicase RecQ